MSESTPKPSPEVEQLALLGQASDAVKLYMKQAGVDEEAAHSQVEELAE